MRENSLRQHEQVERMRNDEIVSIIVYELNVDKSQEESKKK